jgi:hypothetical protein
MRRRAVGHRLSAICQMVAWLLLPVLQECYHVILLCYTGDNEGNDRQA